LDVGPEELVKLAVFGHDDGSEEKKGLAFPHQTNGADNFMVDGRWSDATG
jgi:hypothetical protein